MTHLQDPDDIGATKEVMGIACNFADGAKELVTLVIGLSVIKPLLSWLGVQLLKPKACICCVSTASEAAQFLSSKTLN